MSSDVPTATTNEHRNSNPVAAAVHGASRNTLTTPSPTSGSFGVGSLILVFSLVLFLFGFLLGRQRQNNAADHTSTRPHANTIGASKRRSMSSQNGQPRTMPNAVALQAFMPTHTPAVGGVKPKPVVQPFQADTPAPPVVKPAMANTPVLAKSNATVVSSPVLQTAGHDASAALLTPQQQPPDASVLLEIDPTPTPAVNPISSMALASRPHTTALPTPRRSNAFGHFSKPRKAKSAGDSNIDLAKIYLSMGDPTTAQMVLRQVLEEGSDAEKAIAEQLMQEMA